MKAKIYINYKEGILDPEGATVSKALKSIGINGITELLIGKCIEMSFDNQTKEQAIKIVEDSCTKLLANPNTEVFQYKIIED
ncbi:phosphoribosylformylglycinamidine synthase subunit PurS [Candidatus Marinimicrobia bacterium]|jgi:phosphoribosylformylglycinamidine synthase PurS subunit|nr:phosphoribosylformylglycinamidine synthase subunit PurS [Candidatus Neomarinimicrobiota bacterium]|tara:strand:+ start:689 stop:934 length:246 start_codon:yes stop_codon:yes gene_type:complete